jgi:ubiquinone/menaquinone biosynthesis C-methylase UbiE
MNASLARRLYYRLPPPARRLLRPDRRPPLVVGELFATFERDDAPPVELYDRYRTALKPRWRVYWRETRILLALYADGLLPPELARRAEALLAARTLPESVDAIGAALLPLADALPERLAGLELVPTVPEVEALAQGYRRAAAALLGRVGRTPQRALEIGAGSGYLAFAVAACGAGEVVASDLDPEGYVDAVERERVRQALRADTVALVAADAHRLPFEDGSFDLVFSSSAIEHLRDPAAAFGEVHRVLQPGGTSHHVVDSWFGPGGGHSLCGTDAPWGHVRLNEDEFARYVERYRPVEAADAVAAWAREFQQPRLTSAELAEAARAAGFEIVALELPRRSDHVRLLTPEIERDCLRVHPHATRHDLLAASVVLLLRRPE